MNDRVTRSVAAYGDSPKVSPAAQPSAPGPATERLDTLVRVLGQAVARKTSRGQPPSPSVAAR